jgi:glycosyltransferase involved in cell wall biosynthesis
MDKAIISLTKPFSVLISVYSKEIPDFFRRSLESIWSDQSVRPNEIVIVKDGPVTAELSNVIDDFCEIAPIKVITLERNMGLGIALAEGLASCSNNIVARMDGDDISYPIRFEEQFNYLMSNSNIDLVGSWIAEFENSPDDLISLRKVPETTDTILKYAKHRNPINHPSVMFKKSSVLNAGNYKVFESMEDYSLWVRMLLNGCEVHNIQKPLLFFRSSRSMYKRRHGKSYYFKELRFQGWLLRIGFINKFQFSINYIIRIMPRLLPISFLKIIYRISRI